MKKFKIRYLMFPLVFLVLLTTAGWVVKYLWNAILPPLTGAGLISYWQAVGLLILSKILFGHAGFKRGHRPPFFRHELKEKWMQMSSEEKDKFRDEWKKRCHG